MVSYACSACGQGLDGLVVGIRGLDRVFSGCECRQPPCIRGQRRKTTESSAEQGAETTSTARAQTTGQTLPSIPTHHMIRHPIASTKGVENRVLQKYTKLAFINRFRRHVDSG